MSSEGKKTDHLATPEEIVSTALNEQGFLFQQRLGEELKELRGPVPHGHNWMVEASEIPVSLPNGRETRVDLVLKNQGSQFFAVVEAKRFAKDFKRWVFFGKTHGWTLSSNGYFIEYSDVQSSTPQSQDVMHRVERKTAAAGVEAFEYYLEARAERPGTQGRASATTAIEDAFRQVTLGQAGLALRMRHTNVFSFRLIPVVITTAQVFHADFTMEKISMEHGTLQPNDLKLEPRRWVAVNYRIDDSIAEDSGFTTNRQQELEVDMAVRQVRTVFVVQALHMHEFFAWLSDVCDLPG